MIRMVYEKKTTTEQEEEDNNRGVISQCVISNTWSSFLLIQCMIACTLLFIVWHLIRQFQLYIIFSFLLRLAISSFLCVTCHIICVYVCVTIAMARSVAQVIVQFSMFTFHLRFYSTFELIFFVHKFVFFPLQMGKGGGVNSSVCQATLLSFRKLAI